MTYRNVNKTQPIKNQNIVKLAHLNIRSLLSSIANLKDLILNGSFEVMGISETWLDSCTSDEAIALENYQIFRKDRLTRGGGVLLYIHTRLKPQSLSAFIDPANHHTDVEQTWAKIQIGRRQIAVGVIYKPPHASHLELQSVSDILRHFRPLFDDIVLLGDININMLQRNVASNYINSLLHELNLTQLIQTPTRITAHSESLIDVIIVTSESEVLDVDTFEPNETISDHMVIHFSLKSIKPVTSPKLITYRDYKFFSADEFYGDANNIDWRQVYSFQDINDKVDFINSNIIQLFNKHAPFKSTLLKKPAKNYITWTIKRMINCKKKALRAYTMNKTPENRHRYVELRNMVNCAVKKEKAAYIKWELNLCGTDQKAMWSVLNKWDIVGGLSQTTEITIASPHEINAYFVNNTATCTTASCNLRGDDLEQSDNTFNFKPLYFGDLCKYLTQIKSKASGVDGITLRMIHLLVPVIGNILTHILNTSLFTAQVPELWKTAVITPIPKKAVCTELSQLRPISVLPVLSKILEKAVNEQLCTFAENNNILPETQCGFRKHHSTATALVEVNQYICEAMEKGKLAILILLDLSKAFDSVEHSLLINILRKLGVSEYKWFANYLNERKQKVKLGNEESDYLITKKGVPQGSILGPLLFSLYTSSMSKCIRVGHPVMYADDTQIVYEVSNTNYKLMEDTINIELRDLNDWCTRHGLTINPSKSVVLAIGTEYRLSQFHHGDFQLKIEIAGQPINIEETARNLGIQYDQYLSFEHHTNYLTSMAFMKLKKLNQFRNILPFNVKWRLVESLIISQLNYCDVVYCSHLTQNLGQKLQKVQNAGLRFAHTNISRRTHVTPYYRRLKLLKITDLQTIHYSTFVHKIITLRTPKFLYDALQTRAGNSERNSSLRNFADLALVGHKSAAFEKSFRYRAPKVYNALPNSIKNLTVQNFKTVLKRMYLEKQSDIVNF